LSNSVSIVDALLGLYPKPDPRLTKTEYYLQMLKLVAARSTCVRRAVGAIITDREGRVLSTGYNGVPRNFDHCTEENPCEGASQEKGNTSLCMAVHAEQNAIIQCSDLNRAYTIYVSCVPCFVCAKMLANTNIEVAVCETDYADTRGKQVLMDAGWNIEIRSTKTLIHGNDYIEIDGKKVDSGY